MKSNKKQKIIIYVLGVSTLVVTIIGATFSYFTSAMTGTIGVTNLSTKLVGNITFTAQPLDASDILPGWSSGAKAVTVTAEPSNIDLEYTCTLNIAENGLSDLKLVLAGDNYVAENSNIILGTSSVTLARGTIPASDTTISKTMTYTISLPETGTNQTLGNSGKFFVSTVSCELDDEVLYYEGSNNVVATTTKLYDKLLADNPTRLTRTSFTSTFTDTNTGALYTQSGLWTEDVTGDGAGETVYYFAGDAQNNWVKFGKEQKDTCTYNGYQVYYRTTATGPVKKGNLTENECTSTNICEITNVPYYVGLTEEECAKISENATYLNAQATFDRSVRDIYWRIIRTNEDGGIRLLYAGNSPETLTGFIGYSQFNGGNDENYDNKYAGYMYGTSGSLENHRTNTNNSTIKNVIDSWYNQGLNTKTDGTFTYDSYVSKTAIYCNDRSSLSETINMDGISLAAEKRIMSNKKPSYKCGVDENGALYSNASAKDKFSVSDTSGGNGDLTYPVALMTADEIAYAGGVTFTYFNSETAWFYTNSNGLSITNNGNSLLTGNHWWTMTPGAWFNTSYPFIFVFDAYGHFSESYANAGADTDNYDFVVRPVLSLKSCVLTTGGNGSSASPYLVATDLACTASEN